MIPQRCAIIFDWNGTILADTSLTLRAMNETLAAINVAPATLKSYRDTHTVPLNKMYVDLGCDPDLLTAHQSSIFSIYGKHYEAHSHKIRPRRGAKQALGSLRTRGHKTAILSNYEVMKIEQQAERLGLLHMFDAVMANEGSYQHIFNKRTKGERLHDFITQNETHKGIVVGDTLEEIDIAQQFGFVSVAISDGVCSTARLRAAKPDFLVRNLAEIPDIAAKVFGKGGAK